MTGTQVEISIPANGNVHDVWTGTNTLPRIRQSIADEDFDVVVKFESDLAFASFVSQGILIEQDDLNVLRIEFQRLSSQTKFYSEQVLVLRWFTGLRWEV